MTSVVVTGIGVVTPIGTGSDVFWDALVAGRSGCDRITRFDPSDLPVQIACEVKDFDPASLLQPTEISRADRFTHYGIAAAVLAWQNAGMESVSDPNRAGALIGTSMGGVETIEREQGVVLSRGASRVNPLAILKMMPNEAAAMVSMRFGLFGASYALSSACATGAQVIGEAARAIRFGAADVMIAGGCDAAITPLWIGAFARMGAISRRNDDPAGASRPFDAGRDGFVFAEGAGALILESRDHAESRGAEILAEVAGYGVSNDANHLAQPHPEGAGAAQAMRFAMDDAHVTPGDVEYINAHGTGTAMNDRAETIAIKNALGPESKRIPTSSTKSQIGHTMGAAGVIEAAATILSMRNSVIPATINLTDPDPECDLDYVADGPRETKIRVALSNSFGLGGHNACIALKAP